MINPHQLDEKRFDWDQVITSGRLEPGAYCYEVVNVQYNTQSNQFQIILVVDGSMRVHDWISVKHNWRLSQLLESVGIEPPYTMRSMLTVIGKKGRGLFEYRQGRNGRQYLKVRKYFAKDTTNDISKDTMNDCVPW